MQRGVDNSGREIEVVRYGQETVEGRIRGQSLASKQCASAEKGFGGIETPDRR